MPDLHKLLTTYHGAGPKRLYKKLPDGNYAEVVVCVDYETLADGEPINIDDGGVSKNIFSLPKELVYDDKGNLIELKFIDEVEEKEHIFYFEYDEKDNLVSISRLIHIDL